MFNNSNYRVVRFGKKYAVEKKRFGLWWTGKYADLVSPGYWWYVRTPYFKDCLAGSLEELGEKFPMPEVVYG